MKTVIYEPKYLEYPGVSLPTPEYGNSSGLADLFNLPEVTPQQEVRNTILFTYYRLLSKSF